MIDLEELAGGIAARLGEAQLTPVIEKEIVHYEIISSLKRNGLLQDITFQGGTSLRLCYGSQRYSEDLDFAAGEKFDSLPLAEFSRALRADLLKSYDAEVSVKEPKVVRGADGVGMRRWTISVNTNIGRPDLPLQRIKLEIASVPAHTSVLREAAVNYPELGTAYDDLLIRCQSPEEILADKLISFSATDSHVRHRDLWDIPWLARRQGIDLSRVPARRGKAYRLQVPETPPKHDRHRRAARRRLLLRRVIRVADESGSCPHPCSGKRLTQANTGASSARSSKRPTRTSPAPLASPGRSRHAGESSPPT